MVLPEAERRRDAKTTAQTMQPRAQLVEVLDEASAGLRISTGPIGAHAALQLGLGRRPRPGGLSLASAASRSDGACRLCGCVLPSCRVIVVVVLAGHRALELADPRPSERPSSGRRLGPKMISTITSTIAISGSYVGHDGDGRTGARDQALPVYCDLAATLWSREVEVVAAPVGSAWPWYLLPSRRRHTASRPAGRGA